MIMGDWLTYWGQKDVSNFLSCCPGHCPGGKSHVEQLMMADYLRGRREEGGDGGRRKRREEKMKEEVWRKEEGGRGKGGIKPLPAGDDFTSTKGGGTCLAPPQPVIHHS